MELKEKDHYSLFKLFYNFGSLVYDFKPVKEYCYKQIFGSQPKQDFQLNQFGAYFKNLIKNADDKDFEICKFLKPKVTLCENCKGDLTINKSSKDVVLYVESSVVKAERFSGRCRKCSITYHYGYKQKDGIRCLNMETFFENDYFLSTEDTAFSIKMMEKFDWELALSSMSFRAKSAIFNNSLNNTKEKTALGRKRLVLTFLNSIMK